MKARIRILIPFILLPVMASADEKPPVSTPGVQAYDFQLSDAGMQKFLQRLRPDLFSPEALRIAMNWKAGRASNTNPTFRVASRKARRQASQNRNLFDCSNVNDRDKGVQPFYERNDRCGAIFQTSPFREPPP